ncbi:hypothetical protein Pla123a_30540 [Posidoniimonas polymericola]|uniref:Glycosyl hydrolases family 2, sugar binding domain n=1 Tax=Posidoniimonas polymericola TaxID=2528002 RepID=A0A5C5YL23_9BACT|nr:glycosyl hydrolase [Posidoniimonas polymericola]TWT75544.1 hypothetical protein Pla123a_30540 [Posidoniimonas polymericola]
MTAHLFKYAAALLLALAPAVVAPAQEDAASFEWPEATQTARPWTRWWWHGSAVDAENLTRLLEEYHSVGIGGVEITCIYGVQDNDDRDLQYRSAEWVKAVQHVIAEAERLGMGVDIPAGSGWRMGGPNQTADLANSRLVLDTRKCVGPSEFAYDSSRVTLQAATAQSAGGEVVNLTDKIRDGRIEWDVPAGDWTITTAGYRWAGDKVKRPGPGGEGLNINPFWRRSVDAFLTDFGSTLDQLPGIRAQFHDSFEYEGDWQPEFFAEFYERRGYRLEEHLEELSGEGEADLVARVKCDYRETLADLVRDDLVKPWVDWSHEHGMLARNQSHGSPANWLDLYAACDIPETESFGRLHGGDAKIMALKFASSAANVAGKPLTSSESATWLDEHFHVTLAEVKQLVDRQILSGVNHLFYHGTAYSPADAAWPGWLFYASTQVNPQNPIWRDLPSLNQYITRCQSLLQSSQPDNDVLLYWPLHDFWHDPNGLRKDVRVHNFERWFEGHPCGDAAEALDHHGCTFDFISDALLQQCEAAGDNRIKAPGAGYRAVVVPRTEHMPLATLTKLVELAESGCPVLVEGGVPTSPPGLKGAESQGEWAAHRREFNDLARRLSKATTVGDDLTTLLDKAPLRLEPWAAESGLKFLRKRHDRGVLYFLSNTTDKAVDEWINPAAAGEQVLLVDPTSGQAGGAAVRGKLVRIQVPAGESLFLIAAGKPSGATAWQYDEPAGDPITLAGDWKVEYVTGGPSLPESFASTSGPQPWTDTDDPAAEVFGGAARYTHVFSAPEQAVGTACRLCLGEVFGSARVALNGDSQGVLLGPDYCLTLEGLRPGRNRLEIEVTGVAANRIRDLDRRGVAWRIFKDINLVTIKYRKFDASGWPVEPMGLAGPVTLTPLRDPAE